MMRLAIVTAGFGPYRVPLWNAVAERAELTMVFLSDKEKHRLWSVDFSALKCPVVSVGSRQLFIGRLDWSLNISYGRVKKALDEIAPEAIIVGGYDSPGCWAAKSWARTNRVPMVLWLSSTLLSTRTRGNPVIDGMKRNFIKGVDAYYVTGSHSADYVAYFGAPRERIVVGCNIPDVTRFKEWERIGFAKTPTLLYVGQLIGRKGVLDMVAALSRVSKLTWRLKVAGDGPLKERFLQEAEKGGILDKVELLGYVQQERLAEVYRSADILLFPSLNEVWGLVVNEALLSGLFVVGTDRAAASLELIRPGVNGLVASPSDPEAFSEAVRNAISSFPYDRAAIRSTVVGITPEAEADKMIKAVSLAQESMG